MNKPKTNQPKTPNELQERDFFQTPNYATDLLIPYLCRDWNIWEPACGHGKIVNRLQTQGFSAFGTDLQTGQSFFEYKPTQSFGAIVSNIPFSLKPEFYAQALTFGVPFAFLMPLDFCGWILEAMKDDRVQWIAPTRRIDYITPDMLNVIFQKSTLANAKKVIRDIKKFSDLTPEQVEKYAGLRYEKIEDVPGSIIAKYSASQYHSGWFCYGLNLPKQITIVELTKAMKENV